MLNLKMEIFCFIVAIRLVACCLCYRNNRSLYLDCPSRFAYSTADGMRAFKLKLKFCEALFWLNSARSVKFYLTKLRSGILEF